MLSSQRQREILRDDRKRRNARQAIEDLELSNATQAHEDFDNSAGAFVNPCLVKGAGVVTPKGLVRHTRPYGSLHAGRLTWANVTVRDAHSPAEVLRQIPTFGWAVGVFGEPFAIEDGFNPDGTPKKIPTVRVETSDGNIEFRTVRSFAPTRNERATRSTAPQQNHVPETARIQSSARDLQAMAEGTA